MNDTESKIKNHSLVLAIDPTTRGFAYTLFEGPKRPLDWGVTDIRNQVNKRSLKRIKELIEQYEPEVLVLEKYSDSKSHRCERVQKLIEKIITFARLKRIKIKQYSRGEVSDLFLEFGAKNKGQIAEIISDWLPPLAPRIPPKRKIWMSEDQRINIFDAASMALTFYYHEEVREKGDIFSK